MTMFLALKTPLLASSAALVLANLVPLAGALLGYWSSFELMLLFWAENIVIGLFQILRMATVLGMRREREVLALIPFFAMHYGLFTYVHGFFLVLLFGGGLTLDAAVGLLGGGLLWPVLGLVASHGLSFALNFWGAGEWRSVAPNALMKQPYGRVVLLHLVIMAGGFIALALQDATIALALLVLAKIAVDLRAHWREHRAAAAG
ncbi:DUF6498-containing protein [Falsiroseomonas tokyonensis]|uniref:DUF6498-containing protein n=1 Tax=Falsiroseomonas tokyonensis TaxID=430521 RepID=A0ABV7BX93_9PROT|nr:DUF6498-containing protein [Falsiroseomonas tokyonensis]MBU8540278.1 hypothetical protein [Falsiroseomonas tokyonensis]